MSPVFLIGAFSNGVRGGQWKAWFGLPAEYRLFANDSDILNAATYAIATLALTASWLMAIAGFVVMWLGAAPGWGDYIGNLLGNEDPELKENKVIDPLIKWLKPWPKIWGAAGLLLRGAFWGVCLSAPWWYIGDSLRATQFIIAGSMMPLMYFLAGKWIETRIGKNIGAAWGLGEIFFGAVLWSPLS